MFLLLLMQNRRGTEGEASGRFPHICTVLLIPPFVPLLSIQRGKDDYKPAATSEHGAEKSKKARKKKDIEDLKKEVDLVSIQLMCKSTNFLVLN